jgi:hypothetical protein
MLAVLVAVLVMEMVLAVLEQQGKDMTVEVVPILVTLISRVVVVVAQERLAAP